MREGTSFWAAAAGLALLLTAILQVHAPGLPSYDPQVLHPHAFQGARVGACVAFALWFWQRGGGVRTWAFASVALYSASVALTYGVWPMAPALAEGVAGALGAAAEGAGCAIATLLLVALCACGTKAHAWAGLVVLPAAMAASHVLFALQGVLLPGASMLKPVLGLPAAVLLLVAVREVPASFGAEELPSLVADTRNNRISAADLVGLVVFPFVFVLFVQIALASPTLTGLHSPIIELIDAAALAAIACASWRLRTSGSTTAAFVVCNPLFATAMMLLPFMWETNVAVCVAIIQATFYAYNAFLWMLPARASATNVRGQLVLLGVATALLYLFALLGRLAGGWLAALPVNIAALVSTVSIAGVWVLSMCLLGVFLFRRTRNQEQTQEPAAKATEPFAEAAEPSAEAPTAEPVTAAFEQRCTALAQAHGISERELEVMALFARGRSSDHIANELFISKETVKTHIKRVYRKLDIHSRQELLDLIEAYVPHA